MLVRTNVWFGSRAQARIPARPVPGQLRAWVGLQDAGASVALITEAVPVPLKDTGDPVTVTLPVMVNVPATGPVTDGENTTLMVQVPAAAVSVAPQVPPAAPAGLEKVGDEKASVLPVRLAAPVL